jgi:hypothetical protein
MFQISTSKANSGVWTPTTVSLPHVEAVFHASTWGSDRWQLMNE